MANGTPDWRITAIQTDHMTARIPASDSGILGVWWSEGHSVMRWDAQRTEARPDGRVELLPTGYLQLVMGDAPGWRPYISVKGIMPQTSLICRMRYRFDGSEVSDDVPLNFDNAAQRHVGVGSICDGTLGANNKWGGIMLSCLSGVPFWGFDEITFGYVQLGEPA